jgi:hypothetical protein
MFNFTDIVRGFSAGGNKVEAGLALVDGLFSAAKAVYDVVKASSEEKEEEALAELDAQLARVAPISGGLRAIIEADRAAARQELRDRFGSKQP